ncbi:hypothetical protein BN134_2706 [Cronobacter dublinensis 1210]|uniref:Uncharacterized protein n=1 Tax=Cronobacter dublinensis 1210 TaxID=1208656 RepID=A0ABP1WBA5_9ENTR|nr:hypothetical protein BN134_2706 [Cronobacter dublinensis 1210]
MAGQAPGVTAAVEWSGERVARSEKEAKKTCASAQVGVSVVIS